MTDDKIKEEFIKWHGGIYTESEGAFLRLLGLDNFIDDSSDLAAGFYGGFRTAERLAKIEVLEELRDKSEYKMDSEMYRFFTRKINELKEGEPCSRNPNRSDYHST